MIGGRRLSAQIRLKLLAAVAALAAGAVAIFVAVDLVRGMLG